LIAYFWRFLTTLYRRTVHDDDCPSLAAAVSFYALLSFIPLVMLLVSVIGHFVASSEVAYGKISEFLTQYLPVSTTSSAELLAHSAAKRTVYGIVGAAGLIWTSMHIFDVLEQAMQRIWRPRVSRSYWRTKFAALICIPFMAIFTLLSITATGLLSLFQQKTIPLLNITVADLPFLGDILARLLPVFLSLLLFLSINYLLPRRWDHFRHALIAALLSALLWEGAKLLFDYYMKNFSYLETIYGSFTSLAVLALWVYYSSFIVLFGAEFGSLLKHLSRMKVNHPSSR
jgi:membrane protein